MSRLFDLWQQALTRHRFLFFAITIMVLLRIPSLFEGFWYGDEGIYAALAQGMHQGKELYAQVWDHKPPLIYWIYYIGGFVSNWFMALALIKTAAIVCSGLSLWLVYRIANHFEFSDIAKNITVMVATLLLGLPILEANTANAEIFFIPCNLAVIYLLLRQRWYFLIGVLAGIGAMLKFHSGFESAFVVLVVLLVQQRFSALAWAEVGRRFARIVIGGLLVIAPYALYVAVNGLAQPVLDAILWYNFQYTSYANDGLTVLGLHLSNSVIYLALLLLGVGSLYLGVTKQKISLQVAIIGAILGIEYIAAILPGRAYGHYLIQVVPGAALALGLLTQHLVRANIRRKLVIGIAGVLLSFVLVIGFLKGGSLYGPSLIAQYYREFATEIVLGANTNHFPYHQGTNAAEVKRLADYIDRYHADKQYYFYGNQPWLFALTDDAFTNTYVVWYHQPYDYPANQIDSQRAELVIVDTSIWQADLFLDQVSDLFENREDYDRFALLW